MELSIWHFYKEYLESLKKKREEEVESLIRSAFTNGSTWEDYEQEGLQSETQTQE